MIATTAMQASAHRTAYYRSLNNQNRPLHCFEGFGFKFEIACDSSSHGVFAVTDMDRLCTALPREVGGGLGTWGQRV